MTQEHDDAKTGDVPESTAAAEAAEGASLVDENADKADEKAELGEGEFDVEADEEGDDAGAEDDGIETSDFEVNDPTMLLGEMRDHVLRAFKRTSAWKGLGEKEQRYLANEVEQACRQVIYKAVRVAATMDLDAIEVTIKDPGLKSDKEQIEAKIIMDDDAGAWMRLRLQGKRTLVFADAEALMNARAAAVMKDQPGLFEAPETPAEKDKREVIEAEQREQAESLARAHQFKQLDDTPTVGSEAAKVVGEMLPPAIRAAADRGVAHRQAGGGKTVPRDLEGKVAEVAAWLKGWDSADAQADGHGVDTATGDVAQAEPAKAPRGHRGKRTSVEQRVAKRVAETAGA